MTCSLPCRLFRRRRKVLTGSLLGDLLILLGRGLLGHQGLHVLPEVCLHASCHNIYNVQAPCMHAYMYGWPVLTAGTKVRVQELVVGIADGRPSDAPLLTAWLGPPGEAFVLVRVALSLLRPLAPLFRSRALLCLLGTGGATLGRGGFGRWLSLAAFPFCFRFGLGFGRSFQIYRHGRLLLWLWLGPWSDRLKILCRFLATAWVWFWPPRPLPRPPRAAGFFITAGTPSSSRTATELACSTCESTSCRAIF